MHELLTKEQAFTKLDDEKSIKIKQSQHDFKFTTNWFRVRNQRTWSTFLPPRFDGTKPMNMIQIGVFEGADLVWCLQNILTHKDSRVIAIDPWTKTVRHDNTTKLNQDRMTKCYKNAIYNLKPWANKVKIIRDSSHVILPNLMRSIDINGIILDKGQYDLIVIDGDHRADAVYKDAVDSLHLVKVGGWMLFDDFYNRKPKIDHVHEGVLRFLDDYGDSVELVWQHRFSLCFKKLESL